MIHYVCKYTPIELFAGFGETCAVLEEMPENFEMSDQIAHANLCGFGKSVIQAVLQGKADELVMVNCCDSMRRVYDIVASTGKCKFLYMLDLPHDDNECEKEKFAAAIRRLKEAYEKYSGKTFDKAAFFHSFAKLRTETKPYIGVLGVRVSGVLEDMIRENIRMDVDNLTCTGGRRLTVTPEELEKMDEDAMFLAYADGLLGQMPCFRMNQSSRRTALYLDPNLKGIIYHTIKFCDYYGFEYASIKKNIKVPLLKIETDFTSQSAGQLLTRIQAFSETIEGSEDMEPGKGISEEAREKMASGVYYVAGIDSGSTSTDVVILDQDGKIKSTMIIPTGGGATMSAEKSLELAVEKAGIKKEEIVRIDTTGYGRAYIDSGDDSITEITCHAKGAHYLNPNVRTVIDIGGQDIKCFQIKNHSIDSIMLNEACSSGCGSFIQAFAVALGYDIAEFSKLGLFAEHPVDLGSRCTVFMNSSVKQAQKDGATVEDISAGLSGSIVKNAIYKVIRARNPEELGQHIVVQGGTFLNDAVLRCFEREIGHDVIRPAISGLMGAFGAALYAQEKSTGTSTLLNPQQLQEFSYTAKAATCKGCTAHCALSVIRFNNGGRFISGNRCEKGAGKKESEQLPNLFEWKYRKILSLEQENQPAEPKATVGLPLALHYYDQMPLWHTFFTELGFAVKFSEESTRGTYYKGQSTIPSDTVCYPAKLTHGHIESLLEKGVDFIFYPCMSYNIDEGDSDNHFNCPVVAYYPELLMANCEKLNHNNFLYPFLDLNRRGHVVKTLSTIFSRYATKKQVETALEHGFAALEQYRKDITAEGEEIVRQAREAGRQIIVLAGRPYHIDPEINHGIHKLIGSLGLAVITEDSVAHLAQTPELQALNQWTYHSRMYRAAKYVTTQPDMQLVQLVSFGCGIDAITTDEVRRILETGGKLYTQLKIDEISNLGAIKIRLRSLIAAMEQTQEQKQTEPETA